MYTVKRGVVVVVALVSAVGLASWWAFRSPNPAPATDPESQSDTAPSAAEFNKPGAPAPPAAANVAFSDSEMDTSIEKLDAAEALSLLANANGGVRDDLLDAVLDERDIALLAARDMITTGTVEERLLACTLLAESRDSNAEQAILDAMDDADTRVQVRATLSLRHVGDGAAVEKIRTKLAAAPNTSVEKACLVSLAFLGTEDDVAPIRKRLNHPDESVRVTAAGAMARLGNYEGLDVVLAATESANPLARIDGVYALGFVNTPEARARLEQIISDPKGLWKSQARMALANLDLAQMTAVADKVDALEAYARDPNEEFRDWAVDELAHLNTVEADGALRTLAREDRDSRAAALLRIRGEEVQ